MLHIIACYLEQAHVENKLEQCEHWNVVLAVVVRLDTGTLRRVDVLSTEQGGEEEGLR